MRGDKIMPSISQRSNHTPKSAIREIFAMQAELDNVISFALGEPDFTTPDHIIEAVIASFKRGETHYTPNRGIPVLREAIAKSYQSRGLHYNPNEIIVSAGAIGSVLLAAFVLLDVGDEVILADPGYANYMGVIKQVNAVPVPVQVYEENGFMYDIHDLRAAITDKTKLLLLNSPSNPTGGVASAENLKQISDLVIENDLYIMTDEIYREILWDDEAHTSIASFPGMKERTIIIDGFSKTYAMTGFRLGYAAAPEMIIDAMAKHLENVVSSVNEGIQWGGVAALSGSQECVELMKQHYRRRKEIIVNGLNLIPGISCIEPKGAFYAFANIRETGLSSRDFAIRLLKEKRVALVPGTGFGAGGEGFVRLSYATSEENIKEGLKRIGEFVDSISKK